jgi:hypothetical protein
MNATRSCLVLIWFDRRHHLCVRHGNGDIGGVNSSHTATRHLHTHQSDLYDSFTASKYCVAKTLLLADVSDSSDFTPRSVHRHNCVHNQPPHRCIGSSDDVILSSPARSAPYSPHLSAAASQSRHCLRDDADVTSRRPGAIRSCECCLAEPGNSLLMLSGGCVVCNQRPAVSGATCRTDDDLQHQQYYVIDRRHRQELGSTRASKHSHNIADDSNISLRRADSATSLTVSGPDRLAAAPPPADLQRNHVDLTFQHASATFKDDVTVT